MQKSETYMATDLASRSEFLAEELKGDRMIMTFSAVLTKLPTGSYPEPGESNRLSHTLLKSMLFLDLHSLL